jgi:hypothetical protein
VLDLPSGRVPPASSEPPAADRTVATAVAVVLGLVLLVIVLSFLTGGDRDDAAADDPTTTTTRPPTSTTTLPRPSSSTHPVLAEGERLDPAFDMAVVSIRSNGTVAVADLATGDEHILDERIPLAPIQSASWIGTTFVARSSSPQLHRLVPGTANDWEPVDTLDLVADPYWPGPPGLVSLWDPQGDGLGDMQFGVVGPDGPLRVVAGLPVVMVGAPLGFVGLDAVFNSPDGVFLVDPGGAPRRLDHGLALGVADGRVVRRSCDDQMVCRLLLDEPATGQTVELGPVEPTALIQRAIPSPDGDAVALVAAAGDELTLRVLPVPLGRPATWVVGQRWGELHMLRWSADGDGLVWIDGEQGTVRSVRWRGEDLTGEPAAARLSVASPTSFEATFIVPVAALPTGWAPPRAE